MTASSFRRLGHLALFACAVALGPITPAQAQYNDRYDRPPPAGADRGNDRDEDDRDEPPAARRYDDRDARDARDDDDDRPPSTGGRDTSYDAFYEDLEQYGRWQEHPRYGDIWVPREERSEWRPYTRGSWTYTEEYGWYWTSTEPWGWATYHYGRWAHDDRHGWFWVPGREWAPAWVTWRYSDDLVGWAPLPPDGYGFAYNDDFLTSSRYAPFWIFVAPRYLMTPGLHRYAEPAARNARALSVTRLAPAGGGGRAAARGLDVRTVERLIQRPVTPSRVALTDNRRDPGITRPRTDSITVFKPRTLPQGPAAGAPRAARPVGAPPPSGEPRRFDRQAAPVPPVAPSASPNVAPNASPAPGGFERRRSAPPATPSQAASPPPAAPSAAPSAAPPPRQSAPDGPRAPFNRNADHPHTPPPPPSPPANAAPPVQPRILNQAPPQAAAPPPRPAPPAASGAAPPKEHKREHKKDEPPPPPPPAK